MDVAVRSLKLAFFQLIAPIPILSYIDPKSGKDGLFKKWYEMCFKTFLSLFIRLLALYFAVYVISKVADMQLVDLIDGSYVGGWNLLTVFIIIGALMFAKQLPEILKGLGIKLDGDGKFTLNPLRKMENQMLGGKYLKKPNDALAKLGKGIITAPGQALATGGKRLVAGAYSASNGRGFRRGWESVDSPFKKALNKKIDVIIEETYTQEIMSENKYGKLAKEIFFKDDTAKINNICDLSNIREKIQCNNNSHFYNVDILDEEFSLNKKYDVIFTSNIIDYHYDLNIFRENVFGLLKKDGCFVSSNVKDYLPQEKIDYLREYFSCIQLPLYKSFNKYTMPVGNVFIKK